MAIKKLKVTNFKSFKLLDVELGNFNVVVGANASGKSNFIQTFKFIRDIATLGLDNAVSLQGSEYLINLGISPPQPLCVKLNADIEPGVFFRHRQGVAFKITEINYEFSLNFSRKNASYEIEKDCLILKIDLLKFKMGQKKLPKVGKKLGSGAINIESDKGKIKFDFDMPKDISIKDSDILPPFFMERRIPTKTLLLQTPYFFLPPIEESLSGASIYDFDPKMSKRAVSVAGKSELEEDGSNLSLVLKSIVENENKKKKFSNLIKDLLPFVDDLDTDKFADKSLLFKLRENYFKGVYFPASFISDGTVNISALLIALYFERKNLIIIEEPERNIHPYLISKVMDMMKDASKNKQIIVTTHSPEVVKHSGLENLLLVSRDKDGFSTISRPSEKKEVQIFLKNELGLDDLYVQNLLGD